jgi:trans-aconitate methyltransferase
VSGRAIHVSYKEHIRFIKTNNPKSAYAIHILDNRHEYGTSQDTLQLLEACRKGKRMDCWETLYIQALHQQKVLIDEQEINDTNPLLQMARETKAEPDPN